LRAPAQDIPLTIEQKQRLVRQNGGELLEGTTANRATPNCILSNSCSWPAGRLAPRWQQARKGPRAASLR
jgi:hypothetical protein